MILNIFVHEFEYNVGHSRAMIEVLRNLDPKNVEKIRVICYQHDKLDDLFPNLQGKLEAHKVPGRFLKPFLFKSLFYQFYTAIYFKKKTKEINITMGVCSFVGDIVNIQFAHYLWSPLYFKVTKNSFLKNAYKMLYFKYLDICEYYYYRKPGLKFVFLSKFMMSSFLDKFELSQDQCTLAYSSANVDKFTSIDSDKLSSFSKLREAHPELNGLDIEKHTYLFVGAFERKGLPTILDKIPEDCNFVIVGKPEIGSNLSLPKKPNFFYIPYSDSIDLFYKAFDTFIFPTLFEPFGLVIIEAYMTGMNVIISKEMVGASEIIDEEEIGVDFINPYSYGLDSKEILSDEERRRRSLLRVEKLKDLNWKNCSKEWEKVLSTF